MATTRSNTDGVEDLLDRLGKATAQITKATERQTREADRQLKRLIDRGEASTERLIKAIGKELQEQISGLRRELRDIERRIGDVRKSVTGQTGMKKAPVKQAVAKQPTAKKTAAKMPATKKAPAKKKAAAKQATRKSA